MFEHKGDSARMVRLDMTGNNIVNFCRVDNRLNPRQKFWGKSGLDRVDKRDFIINNQISIIGRSPASLIAMKTAH